MALITLTVRYEPRDYPTDPSARVHEVLADAANVIDNLTMPMRRSEKFTAESDRGATTFDILIADTELVSG